MSEILSAFSFARQVCVAALRTDILDEDPEIDREDTAEVREEKRPRAVYEQHHLQDKHGAAQRSFELGKSR